MFTTNLRSQQETTTKGTLARIGAFDNYTPAFRQKRVYLMNLANNLFLVDIQSILTHFSITIIMKTS